MRIYAKLIDSVVFEVITPPLDPNGVQYPIEECYMPEFVDLCVEITGLDPQPEIFWTYDGVDFSAPVVITPDSAQLANNARLERERQLRATYDPGINMALRALRMASTPEQTAYAEGKIEELDAFAEALIGIPDQPGFPQTIIWPIAPTK